MTIARLLPLLLAALLPAAAAAAADAPPPSRPAAVAKDQAALAKDQAALEQEFAELLTNASLTGSFSTGTDGQAKDGQPKKDSYTILKAEKADGDLWAITAKVEYKGFAVPVEMRVPVRWAGDTPVISITDQKIPMLGTFTARVLFYGKEYAGTWSGGRHGGQMWGRVEKLPATRRPRCPPREQRGQIRGSNPLTCPAYTSLHYTKRSRRQSRVQNVG